MILHNKNAFLSPIGIRVLTPGANILPDDEFEIIKEIPFVKDQLKLGRFTVESSEVSVSFDNKEDAVPDSQDDILSTTVTEILNMDTKLAVKTIIGDAASDKVGILDLTILEAIRSSDTRKGVQKAVDAQINFLTEPPESDA